MYNIKISKLYLVFNSKGTTHIAERLALNFQLNPVETRK